MVTLSYREDERFSLVNIVAPAVAGLECEIWCYEDQSGKAVDHGYDGHVLTVAHKRGRANITSRFEPVADGVEISVEVTGPDAQSVQEVDALNPCWQLRRSDTFGNRGDYVRDFVARCFVVLDGGLTLLKDTSRVPGTRQRPNDLANLPEPWIQEYFPVWREHPGQVQGQRGYSDDRPVYPLIGCVSRDGAHLAAFAWPEARSLGQVWHDCLHPRPAIAESFDPGTVRILSRGRLYFMVNDADALLAAFERDFPYWERPRKIDSPAKNPSAA